MIEQDETRSQIQSARVLRGINDKLALILTILAIYGLLLLFLLLVLVQITISPR